VKRQSPKLDVGAALGELGRARRFDLGSGRELWRLPAADDTVAERLLRLGALGIGGFVDGGQDDDGVWLVRASSSPTLSDVMRREQFAWRDAVSRTTALARVLAACEAESLFPGPLSPKGVVLGGSELELCADGLVATLVGAAKTLTSSAESRSARWIAPEQAGGAPWDNAANRYVLGLIGYRLISGEHPFAGRGLRLGLDEAARRPPPPFPDALASELPPGLMSLMLRMLDPDPGARPKSAHEIVERLAELAAPRPPERRMESAPVERAAEPPAPAPAAKSTPKRPAVWSFSRIAPLARGVLPVVAGLALAAVALAAIARAPEKPKRVLVREPLRAGEALTGDCAGCHPRQTGEWHRSVMAHSVKSPMFQALEILVEEQVGREFDCPEGAGILRRADPATACRDRVSGLLVTGSGGELWCVNCHSPAENLSVALPVWDGRGGDPRSRQPLRDLLRDRAMEGVSCGFCHQVHGPVRPGALARGGYEGNPFWTSTRTGERFEMRPEDRRGLFGIANSGYSLDLDELVAAAVGANEQVAGGSHARPSQAARDYLGKSQFCGACHDVRLFGSDVLGVAERGEHFKRLRNAYSEWADWAEGERRAGRTPSSCQDCHMSSFPGVCVPGEAKPSSREGSWEPTGFLHACPKGTHFSPRGPGVLPDGPVATSSARATPVRPHYFSGVDVPLTPEFSPDLIDEKSVDSSGIPLGANARRDLLLASSVRLDLEPGRVRGGEIELPLVVENVGAGHRVPAGFSQERELWVHLTVKDARGDLVYEVGRVERDDEDLRDKVFLRINTDDRFTDGQGRALGLFGADVADGPDVPRWSPNPARGGTLFRGRGLVNFQNGFLRCVLCIGVVDSLGRCQPVAGQDRARADRYADGAYDIDTGECRSNLSGTEALFETYFPVGALDATRGVSKAPDAIIDTRSLPPGVPERFVYELERGSHPPPFHARAELLFRAFPPYLIRAFAEYERRRADAGKRPSGPLIEASAAGRNTIVELGRAEAVIE
jgi:eukaryotic-like serine/threonine-protein kinase